MYFLSTEISTSDDINVFCVVMLVDYSVFDKRIWHTIGPKSFFFFGTAQFSFGPDCAINYDYNYCITHNATLLIGSRCIPNCAHTNYCWANRPMLQNIHNVYQNLWSIFMSIFIPMRSLYSSLKPLHLVCEPCRQRNWNNDGLELQMII